MIKLIKSLFKSKNPSQEEEIRNNFFQISEKMAKLKEKHDDATVKSLAKMFGQIEIFKSKLLHKNGWFLTVGTELYDKLQEEINANDSTENS